jgi:hypothetical protein
MKTINLEIQKDKVEIHFKEVNPRHFIGEFFGKEIYFFTGHSHTERIGNEYRIQCFFTYQGEQKVIYLDYPFIYTSKEQRLEYFCQQVKKELENYFNNTEHIGYFNILEVTCKFTYVVTKNKESVKRAREFNLEKILGGDKYITRSPRKIRNILSEFKIKLMSIKNKEVPKLTKKEMNNFINFVKNLNSSSRYIYSLLKIVRGESCHCYDTRDFLNINDYRYFLNMFGSDIFKILIKGKEKNMESILFGDFKRLCNLKLYKKYLRLFGIYELNRCEKMKKEYKEKELKEQKEYKEIELKQKERQGMLQKCKEIKEEEINRQCEELRQKLTREIPTVPNTIAFMLD